MTTEVLSCFSAIIVLYCEYELLTFLDRLVKISSFASLSFCVKVTALTNWDVKSIVASTKIGTVSNLPTTTRICLNIKAYCCRLVVTRYNDGQKYCKKCGEYLQPDQYHHSKTGVGYYHNVCGNRVRSLPRHRDDRVKYVPMVRI